MAGRFELFQIFFGFRQGDIGRNTQTLDRGIFGPERVSHLKLFVLIFLMKLNIIHRIHRRSTITSDITDVPICRINMIIQHFRNSPVLVVNPVIRVQHGISLKSSIRRGPVTYCKIDTQLIGYQ